jgi:hypothetical protein
MNNADYNTRSEECDVVTEESEDLIFDFTKPENETTIYNGGCI